MASINKKKVLNSAQKHVKKGNWDAAIAEFNKLIADNPKDRNLHNTVGDLYYKKGDNQLAIEEYKLAAKSFEEDGFIPQTIALLRKILRIDNSRLEVYSKLAQLLSDQGLARDAIAQFKIVADHYSKKGEVKQALDTYKQIADLDPANLKVRLRLAELYNKEGLKDQAISEYLMIADMLNKKGSVEESFHVLQKIIEIDPHHLEAQRGLAQVYLNKGAFDQAVNSLKAVLEIDGEENNLQTLFLMGKAHFKAGGYDQAQAVFEKILSLDPSQIGVRENLGRVYLQKGEFDSALVQFDQVIENFIQKKEYELAKNLLNRLLQFRSDHVRIRERLVEIYETMGDENRVLEELKSLAELYSQQNEISKAVNIYDNLVQRFPSDPKLRNKLEHLKSQLKTEHQTADQDHEFEKEIEKELDDISVDELVVGVEVEVDEDKEIEVPFVDAELEDAHMDDFPSSGQNPDVDMNDLDLDLNISEVDMGSEIDGVDIEIPEEHNFDADQSDFDGIDIETPSTQEDQIDLIEANTVDVEVESEEDEMGPVDSEIAVDDVDGEDDYSVTVPTERPEPNPVEEHQDEAEEEAEEELTDAKIIEDHLYHSELYIKYGLTDKAIEHLHSILKLEPDHRDAHIKIFNLYKDKGDLEKAAEEALFLSNLFSEQHDLKQAREYQLKLAELQPDLSAVPAHKESDLDLEEKADISTSAPDMYEVVEALSKDEPDLEIDDKVKLEAEDLSDLSTEEVDFKADVQEPAPAELAIVEPPEVKRREPRKVTPSKTTIDAIDFLDSFKKSPKIKKPVAPSVIADISDLDKLAPKKPKVSEQSKSKLDSLTAAVLKPPKKTRASKTQDALSALESSLVGTVRKKTGLTPSKPVIIDELERELEKVKPAPEKDVKVDGAKPTAYTQEQEEAEFYLQQGLIEEAKRVYASILKKDPGADGIQEKLDALTVEAEEEHLPEEAVTEETRDDVEEDIGSELEAEIGTEEGPGMLDFGLGEEMSGVKSTFDDNNSDFFNLDNDTSDEGTDLFADLGDTEEKSTEHSLQDLFDEFKKGVDEQVSIEDYETHYNLGIAYNEMGLVDEAISEFEKAAQSPEMYLQCCSMIGLCYMELGQFEQAVVEFQKGIDKPGYQQDEYLGLLYDLGLSYEQLEKNDEAYRAFLKVYELDSKFREVSVRVKELRKKVKSSDNDPTNPSGNVSYV